jgi:hypothetical protein
MESDELFQHAAISALNLPNGKATFSFSAPTHDRFIYDDR